MNGFTFQKVSYAFLPLEGGVHNLFLCANHKVYNEGEENSQDSSGQIPHFLLNVLVSTPYPPPWKTPKLCNRNFLISLFFLHAKCPHYKHQLNCHHSPDGSVWHSSMPEGKLSFLRNSLSTLISSNFNNLRLKRHPIPGKTGFLWLPSIDGFSNCFRSLLLQCYTLSHGK